MNAPRLSVAQVVHSLDPGGTERLVVELATELRRDVDVRVCCLDRAGDWADGLRALGIPVHVLGRRPGFDLRVPARLARLARAHRIDVLHCHQYTPFVYGQLASLVNGTAVVYTEHGRLSDAPPSRRRRLANVVLGRLPGAIFAVSHDLRRFMTREGLPPARVGVIHNGIDPGPSPDAVTRRRARAMLNLPDRSFVAGTAARLDRVKNIGIALRAFAAAVPSMPADARFVVIGDGPERRALEDTAAAWGIAGRTHFLGHRDDVRALLPALDVYVNSSITEGLSVTILEAMAAGVAVVATAVGGTPEILASGVDGILVPLNDPAALATQLRRLASDSEKRARLARAGRNRIVRQFTAERFVEAYRQVYCAVAGRVPSVSAGSRTLHAPAPHAVDADAAGAPDLMCAGERRR